MAMDNSHMDIKEEDYRGYHKYWPLCEAQNSRLHNPRTRTFYVNSIIVEQQVACSECHLILESALEKCGHLNCSLVFNDDYYYPQNGQCKRCLKSLNGKEIDVAFQRFKKTLEPST